MSLGTPVVTVSGIQARVAENILDVPVATSNRILGWIQEAQRRLEDRYKWHAMHYDYFGDASNPNGETDSVADPGDGPVHILTDNVKIDAVTSAFLGDTLRIADEKPYYIKGDTGETVEMEWIETQDQEFVIDDSRQGQLVNPSTSTRQTGPPRYLWTVHAFGIGWIVQYYPYSDSLNPIGDFSAAGEYRIRFSVIRRLRTLGVNSVTTNWFTQFAVDYLEFWATFKALEFNRDPNAQTFLAFAKDAERSAVRMEKKHQIGTGGIQIRPRADFRGNRFTGRSSGGFGWSGRCGRRI